MSEQLKPKQLRERVAQLEREKALLERVLERKWSVRKVGVRYVVDGCYTCALGFGSTISEAVVNAMEVVI